jgi:hypothetical protein
MQAREGRIAAPGIGAIALEERAEDGKARLGRKRKERQMKARG